MHPKYNDPDEMIYSCRYAMSDNFGRYSVEYIHPDVHGDTEGYEDLQQPYFSIWLENRYETIIDDPDIVRELSLLLSCAIECNICPYVIQDMILGDYFVLGNKIHERRKVV